MLPCGTIFLISASLYNIGKLFLVTVYKFLTIGLYTVTKFTFNLCDLGLTCLPSLAVIFLTE